jgi:uncharacterized protein (UPF0548 family)
MWPLSKPSEQMIRAFLTRQEKAAFSYPEVGATRGAAPAGYDADHNRVELGQGAAVFAAACAALRRWVMFPRPWTEIVPADAPIQVGQTVAVLARAFGLWWLNAARVVYVLDEAGPPRRFGFAYGTLADHTERGEERFSVEWHPDGRVWFDLFAFSRPRHREPDGSIHPVRSVVRPVRLLPAAPPAGAPRLPPGAALAEALSG